MTIPEIATNVDDLISRHVRAGMHVHIAATMSRPNALVYALARAFHGQHSLTISSTSIHSSAHALALSGAVRRVITCILGDIYPTPGPCSLYRDLAKGAPFQVEIWSLLSHVQRLMAAALGQPYAVTASLVGSDLVEGKERDLFQVPDPESDNKTVALVTPLVPDITLVHGVCADQRGNVVLCPPIGEGAWSAYAAQSGVLASVERIVPDIVIDKHSDRVVIPGQRVIGLCEAPFGAHPQSLRTNDIAGVTGYVDDYRFLTEIAQRCADSKSAIGWYEEWVNLTGGHEEYLAKLGEVRVRSSSPGSEWPAADRVLRRAAESTTPTRQENLIVLAARAIVERVHEFGYDTVLAGIGSSHMAAWLAAALLRLTGGDVKIVTELGFYGLTPAEGDVYPFSQRHTSHCEQLTGIAEILGGLVASNARCLGVLAAAEIDETGDINTSILGNGNWITGSGGANDIASTTDCLVVALATRKRYVPKVAYVTSPGRRVHEVVSQFGRFQRTAADQPFHLATWLSSVSESDGPDVLVSHHTDWTVKTSDAVREPQITAGELTLLRDLDPQGHYR